MKTLKTIFAIAIITILSACSKDAPATPNDSNAVFRIKEYRDASGKVLISYQYNAQGKISKMIYSDGSFSNYTYNAQNLLTTDENGANVNPSSNSTTNYTYDAAGARINYVTTRNDGSQQKVEYTNNSSGLPTEYKYYTRATASATWVLNPPNGALYFYNANNQVIRFQRSRDYYLTAYDDRGNEIESKNYQLRTSEATYYLARQSNYTFDNKKAPNISNYYTAINNGLTSNSKNFNEDGSIQNESSGTVTYEYNEAGYATKVFRNNILQLSYVLEKVQ